MKQTTTKTTQDKKEFQRVEKAIKESFSEIKQAFRTEDPKQASRQDQEQSTPYPQYYF